MSEKCNINQKYLCSKCEVVWICVKTYIGSHFVCNNKCKQKKKIV